MIITRTPLRMPIAGGGTDLPDFYEKYGSFFISAAIDYYVYLAVKYRPIKGIRLAYSQIEEVKKISEIKHRSARAVLEYLKVEFKRGLEIVSIGDLPAGSGMGSSGSYTVGLLNAIFRLKKTTVPVNILAEEACHINMDLLKEPSGKQDEYIAAYGGIMCFEINKKGEVKAYPLKINYATVSALQNNLLMFYTGISRSASQVLAKQKEATMREDPKMMSNLKKIQEIAYKIKEELEKGNVTEFGKLLDKHWRVKREREAITSPQIDKWYHVAMKNGALGGKIMGAGGGGFFAFYCEEKQERLRKALIKEGLEEVKFHFDFEGSKLLVNI
ncbi:galactokinase [Candidatus Gottesmanbacteria bacterium]|nr:galactokinase [Candidatus Gottesmanbacteria bacterium]